MDACARHARRAVEADEAGDLRTAVESYKAAAASLLHLAEAAATASKRTGLAQRGRQYFDRAKLLAEQLRDAPAEQPVPPPQSASQPTPHDGVVQQRYAELRQQLDPSSASTAAVPTAAQLADRLEVLRGPRFVPESDELVSRMSALSASLPAELGLPPLGATDEAHARPSAGTRSTDIPTATVAATTEQLLAEAESVDGLREPRVDSLLAHLPPSSVAGAGCSDTCLATADAVGLISGGTVRNTMLDDDGDDDDDDDDDDDEEQRILQQAAERAALERRWAPLQTAEIATSAATAREQLKTDSSAVHARASPAVCWDLDDDAEDDVDIELRQWLRTRSLLHLVDYVALLATSMEELVEVTPDEISHLPSDAVSKSDKKRLWAAIAEQSAKGTFSEDD